MPCSTTHLRWLTCRLNRASAVVSSRYSGFRNGKHNRWLRERRQEAYTEFHRFITGLESSAELSEDDALYDEWRSILAHMDVVASAAMIKVARTVDGDLRARTLSKEEIRSRTDAVLWMMRTELGTAEWLLSKRSKDVKSDSEFLIPHGLRFETEDSSAKPSRP
jgi:hypothetical protein